MGPPGALPGWSRSSRLRLNVSRPSRSPARFAPSRRSPIMSRTARLWKGVGPLTLGGILLCGGIAALADDSPPLSQQLTNLGRQAAASGKSDEARAFLRNALKLDPSNAEAKAALGRLSNVRRVAFQDPVVTPPAPSTPSDV